jgi:hypothetical protein
MKETVSSIRIGVTIDENPRIQKILKIFEPTIFPTAISLCHFLAAITDVASSGRDVHTATIVKPMTISDIPNVRAIATAPSTNIFPPKKSPRSHPMIKNVERGIEYFLIPVSSLLSHRLMVYT